MLLMVPLMCSLQIPQMSSNVLTASQFALHSHLHSQTIHLCSSTTSSPAPFSTHFSSCPPNDPADLFELPRINFRGHVQHNYQYITISPSFSPLFSFKDVQANKYLYSIKYNLKHHSHKVFVHFITFIHYSLNSSSEPDCESPSGPTLARGPYVGHCWAKQYQNHSLILKYIYCVTNTVYFVLIVKLFQ